MTELTYEQAIARDSNGLVVLAASPGSGKTTVVAHRLARLIAENRCRPWQGVAVVSFTNVARESVAKEVRNLLGSVPTHPHYLGTIDSFLNNKIFRPFARLALGRNVDTIRVLSINTPWLNSKYPRLQQWNINPHDVTYDLDGQIIYRGAAKPTREIMGYVSWMKGDMERSGLISQSDVNYYCARILREHPQVSQMLAQRYPFMMVDEAQDCSAIQMAILDALVTHGHGEIMLLGDPYQAIYEWRDAEPLLLVSKTEEKHWRPLELSKSMRSGAAICGVLNRLHPNRTIVPNNDIKDSEAVFCQCSDVENTIRDFLQTVEKKGIAITPDNVAVMYGGHRSKANLRGEILNPSGFWADTCGGVSGLRPLLELPLQAKLSMVFRRYGDAYKAALRFFYYQQHKEYLKSDEQLEDDSLATVEARVVLWRFCRQLPNLSSSFDCWISCTNDIIQETCTDLGISNQITPLKKKRWTKKDPVIDDLETAILRSPDRGSVLHSITLENIHQIKGRTFEAAMVYLDSGTGGYKLTLKKLESALSHCDLFEGKYHEDARCFYVACSRARRLLWIVSQEKRITDLALT